MEPIGVLIMKIEKFSRNDLAKWRRTAGMTQQQLADAAGCRRATIANLESNKYNPSLQLAMRIALSLGERMKITPEISDIWEL